VGSLDFLDMKWLELAPAFLGALVILYFLKLKRREIQVSSTYLWKKALEDLRVNSPFQRLRMNILLLLQALVLACLLMALARPVANLRGLTERNHVILIDRSASMQATDGGGGRTRLQRALDEARRIVDGLQSWNVMNDRAVLVAFDDQAELLTPLTEQKSLLREALGRITATDRRTDLHAAVEVARGILATLKQPVLTIISDGKVGDTKDLGVAADVEVHYVKVGEVLDNLAIASIEVRRAFEGGEASRVFATVYNSGDVKKTTGVDCFLEDELVASKEVEVGPHEQASVAFDSPKLRTGRLRAAIDGQDALPVDDVGYAVLREKKDVRVLLVSDGNPFLEKGLEQDPLVRKDAEGRVPRLAPGSFLPDDPGLSAYDLVILDRLELKALGAGNYLIIDALPPFEGIRAKGSVEKPTVVDWDEAHPVARFVSFSSLDVVSARRVQLRKEDRVVVSAAPGGSEGPLRPRSKKKMGEPGEREAPAVSETESGAAIPLVFEARDGNRHCLVLPFDLMKTQSWPLKAAFPIFLANVIRWLGGAGHDERSLAVRTGEVAEIPVPKGATKVTVTDRHGQPHPTTLKEGEDIFRFADTGVAGFYEVGFEGPPEVEKLPKSWFAANIASPDESDIGPAPTIELESRPLSAESKAEEARRELWKALALAAFLILMLEWWVYNRRIYV
jgi:hypothetical protein